MLRNTLKMLGVLACLAAWVPASAPAFAQQASELADNLSPRVLFATSGGFWEKASEGSDTEATPLRGYYRLVAIRGEDNRSLLQLQEIALGTDGPELESSTGIDEINNLGGYITDIRPEDSTGSASQQGFGAYIYLKTEPSVAEPETWVIYIDEFGEMLVERSSN